MTSGSGSTMKTMEAVEPTRFVAARSPVDETTLPPEGPAPTHHPVPSKIEPAQGTLVGRYIVLSRLGTGGMGVVVAAYDPELDRKVALKLLKPRGDDRPSARARLQREAQALARLSHPNVVAVHDVGVHEGQVFVAMEFIAGQTLGQWMKPDPTGRPRPWSEVLRVFEAAGRGLAAAHEVGLVHRDFKPDNVMIGDDGRVCVMDFGLAQAMSDETSKRVDLGELDSEAHDSCETPLTRTGAVLGTPAYMAPEQFSCAGTTARSDQFGYCVALYEALYGTRPFSGDTPAELAYTVTMGSVEAPARGSVVPIWLRKIVVRGLSVAPEDRFADMPCLLEALGTGGLRRRRRRVLHVVGGLAVLVASGAGYRRYEQARSTEACAVAGDVIDQSWSASSRDAVRSGLLATEVHYAPVVADNVVSRIDEHAESWRGHATAACLNATVHGRWTDATYEKAQWCLEERRLQLTTLAEELARADEQVVQRAVQAAARLPLVSTCVDEAALVRMADPPAAGIRPRMASIREEVSRARSLHSTGRYEKGLQVARGARLRAELLSWSPLTARARMIEALLLGATGAYAESEAAGIDAYVEAARAGTWNVAMAAACHLVFDVGYQQARHAEGKIWAQHAAVAIEHAGDPLGLTEAVRSSNLGAVYMSMGEYEEARAWLEQALTIRQEVLGGDHPRVADSLNNLALVYSSMGEYDESKAVSQQVLKIWREALGPEHPKVADSLNNLGEIHASMGEYERARRLNRQALALREQALGPEHPKVADSLNNLGIVLSSLGDDERARRMHTRALMIRKQVLGPEHPRVADSLNNLGAVHRSMGAYEEARAMYSRALALREQALGPEHPRVADSLYNLGQVHAQIGEYEQAEAVHARALALREQALGSEHPQVAQSLVDLGDVLVARGQHEAALGHLERAVTVLAARSVAPVLLASSQFALARVLWDAPPSNGRDRSRAYALVEQARGALVIDAGDSAHLRTRIDQWRAEHSRAAG